MKKVAVVTATRAEYGILRPLIIRLEAEAGIELQLLVTGTHLSEKYGKTEDEIVKDGLPIYARIPILEEGNSAYDVSCTMANAIKGFAEYFAKEHPDLLVVLGDRTEMLGICSAAMNERVPIAHLHGGELTEGAVDDCVRHALTKMSYLHFAASEEYRKRIVQLGENPNRVFNVGALGVENILRTSLLSYEEMCENVGIPKDKKYAVVTFHPVTLEDGNAIGQVDALIEAMRCRDDYFYLITKANADVGGELVNTRFEEHCSSASNAKLVPSLGMQRYLSAVKYSSFVLGNSSSGIIEAPAFGVPTVNIGDRQKGRLMADTIIQCGAKKEEIVAAMDKAVCADRIVSGLYGDGNTSGKIVSLIKDFLLGGEKNLKKKFYDVEF